MPPSPSQRSQATAPPIHERRRLCPGNSRRRAATPPAPSRNAAVAQHTALPSAGYRAPPRALSSLRSAVAPPHGSAKPPLRRREAPPPLPLSFQPRRSSQYRRLYFLLSNDAANPNRCCRNF